MGVIPFCMLDVGPGKKANQDTDNSPGTIAEEMIASTTSPDLCGKVASQRPNQDQKQKDQSDSCDVSHVHREP